MSKTAPIRRPPPKVEAPRRRIAGPEHAARVRLMRRIGLHALLALVLIGGTIWLVGYLKVAIARQAAAALPQRPRIVFVSRPAWMSDYLAAELQEVCRPSSNSSVFERDALVEINQNLKANPWIAKVRQVRRAYGERAGDTIEVDCDFRAPLALVRGGFDEYWFVDAKGVRLPERFTGQDVAKVVYANGNVNLRVIDGVRLPPPKNAGQLWPGDDLAAGLELAVRLNGQTFANEIERIDVSNYGGRVDRMDAYLVLVTKYGTHVKWGRPWGVDTFVEIKPEVKLDTLRRIVARYGRVDAGQPWIDIRQEKIYYPPSPATTQADGR